MNMAFDGNGRPIDAVQVPRVKQVGIALQPVFVSTGGTQITTPTTPPPDRPLTKVDIDLTRLAR